MPKFLEDLVALLWTGKENDDDDDEEDKRLRLILL